MTRDDGYTKAFLKWDLKDAVFQYELERREATLISVGANSFIEYGNPFLFVIPSSQSGIDSYTDAPVESQRTYQYRLRARGGAANSWSAWTEYISSGGAPSADIAAPSALAARRDTNGVALSWRKPPGQIEGYLIQRQELIVSDGNSFFANLRLLDDNIASSTESYIDRSAFESVIYEYRVAGVTSGLTGAYSEWTRAGIAGTVLLGTPANLRLLDDLSRLYDQRYEFWLDWDGVAGADDYEVESVAYAPDGGSETSRTRYVSDSLFFDTAFGRVSLRTRARKLDPTDCAAASDGRCLSDWTAWYDVRFAPKVSVALPPLASETPMDTSTMNMRADVDELVQTFLDSLGAGTDPALVIEFGALAGALTLGAAAIAIAWVRGMAPLGVGMGCGIVVLVLFIAWRLLDTSLAWAVGAQAVVVMGGGYALARQLGVIR